MASHTTHIYTSGTCSLLQLDEAQVMSSSEESLSDDDDIVVMGIPSTLNLSADDANSSPLHRSTSLFERDSMSLFPFPFFMRIECVVKPRGKASNSSSEVSYPISSLPKPKDVIHAYTQSTQSTIELYVIN